MNQKQLSKTIGTSERTLRRMSPRKRQQWQALAAKGRTTAWFDVLAQLMFEVEAFNASNEYEWLWFQVDAAGVKLTRFNIVLSNPISDWSCSTDWELTKALQYVQSLN